MIELTVLFALFIVSKSMPDASDKKKNTVLGVGKSIKNGLKSMN